MGFRIRMKLHNPTSTAVSGIVYKGSVFEAVDPLSRVQNLVVAKDTPVSVSARGTQIIEVESWCLNQSYSPPHGQRFSPTIFQTTRDYDSQSSVWNDQRGRY